MIVAVAVAAATTKNYPRKNPPKYFDVFLTVHHSIDFFKLPT